MRERRRAAGRTQQQLARAVGLHPDVLSHKLNGHTGAVLTAPEVIGIVTALAGWGALVSRAEAEALLESMAVPPRALPSAAWAAPPLAGLAAGPAGPAVPRPRTAAADGMGPADAVPGRGRLRLASLPAPATALIGREGERAEAAAALAASRLVTLTGVGGAGKTRLAVQAAREVAGRFPDGVAFADLAPVGDPALLAAAVAAALGLAPPSASAAEGYVTAVLAGRSLLLVLDNLEHLVEGAPLLGRLLAAAPGLRILVTSRIVLGVYGEQVLRVPPLRLPGDDPAAGAGESEAVRLFVSRAQAACGGFAPDPGELAAIGEICTTLDGLPLAIELAAARVRLYPPRALLGLLRPRLAVLTGGPRDLPSRQQTLRATLDWSYQLLPAPMRHLFACLGVFAGPFGAAAAAAASGERDAAATLDRLAGLAEHSMLEVTPAAQPRFRTLQIVREYALARLAETGGQGDVRRRHLAHYLNLAAAGADSAGPGVLAQLDLLEAAYPDIRAALEFACDQAGHDVACLDEGLRLAAAVAILWRKRGPLADGVLLLGRLLAADQAAGRAAPPGSRAAAVVQACALACYTADYPAALDLARDSVALYEPLGDSQGLARAHRFLGEAATAVGDFTLAASHCRKAIAAARHAGNLRDEAAARNILGQAYRHLGDLPRAVAELRHAVRQFGKGGDPDGAACALHSLGEAERDAGHLTRARELFAAALRAHHAHRDRRAMAYALEGLAGLACLDGNGDQALANLGAARELRRQTGARLAPAEQADLDRITAPAHGDGITCAGRDTALAHGRSRPLADIIAQALGRAEGR